jgi:hypothetical protein
VQARDESKKRAYGSVHICKRWRDSFENFLADMGERPPGKTLDRIDVNGHYEPGNCRWATNKEQCRNKRDNRFFTIDGVTKTLAEWCEIYGAPGGMVRGRIGCGWDLVQAMTTPKGASQRQKGERNPMAKFTNQQVLEIRARPRFNGLGRQLAKEFGVSATVISDILTRKTWKHI